ncbi:hypothetical protein N0V90_010137 [Kalmusia sp. IMI 367209]|nr:hypothetical protein N0V90_010137 [Kalmusia sp. IMI 367209]
MADPRPLPTEIFLNVASQLADSESIDTATLHHLCLTSRFLRDVAQPVLFTYVYLPITFRHTLRQLYLFIRTLIDRPTLGKHVKQLNLLTDVRFKGTREDIGNKYWREAGILPQRLFNSLEPSNESDYPVLVDAILTKVPNLESLALRTWWGQPVKILDQIAERRVTDDFLPKLKTFHVQRGHETGPVSLDVYIHLLEHPALEQICTQGSVLTRLGQTATVNRLSRSNIEMYCCFMDLPPLMRLLEICTTLIQFSFVVPRVNAYNNRANSMFLRPQFAPRSCTQALLATHSSTLERLYVDFHWHYNLDATEDEPELEEDGLENSCWVYPSFRGFERLTYMTIEFGRLMSVNDLPASLVGINLTRCKFSAMSQETLQDWLRLKETCCPAIRDVVIAGEEGLDDGIRMVRKHAGQLEQEVQASADGRILTFPLRSQGVSYVLQLQSRIPLYDANVTSEHDYDETSEEDSVRGGAAQGTPEH